MDNGAIQSGWAAEGTRPNATESLDVQAFEAYQCAGVPESEPPFVLCARLKGFSKNVHSKSLLGYKDCQRSKTPGKFVLQILRFYSSRGT